MTKKIAIVEDEALISHNLELTLTKAGYRVVGIADSVPDALRLVDRENPDIILVDIVLNGPLTGIDLGRQLAERNKAFIYLSANFQDSILEKARTTEPYGFLVKPFREKELLAMIGVVLYRYESTNETRRRHEQALEKTLKDIISTVDVWTEKIKRLARGLQPGIPFDFLNIHLTDDKPFPSDGALLTRVGFDRYKFIGPAELESLTGLDARQIATAAGKVVFEPGVFNDGDFENQIQHCPLKQLLQNIFQLNSCLLFAVVTATGRIVHFIFYSHKQDGYNTDHQKLLSLVQPCLGDLAEHLIRIRTGVKTHQCAKADNRDRSTTSSVFNGIIGNSPVILEVMDNIMLSAPLDASVLILGESGTGKERVAKSIHELSHRKNNPLVTINCASLPANLIESELFGHEKGAFTGAVEKRKGKFEVANKGTIFLDEIGEMPVEMQVRLLRVLQEREVEPVGSNEVMKIDVRVIAATSRDLEQEVKNGNFRLDLYYRLCVLPIVLPPLRQRNGDILLIANHFIEKFSAKLNKKVTGMSEEAGRILLNYQWPGNVRELENTMERAVLQSTGPILENIPIFTSQLVKQDQPQPAPEFTSHTMDANNREFIRQVLQKCRGKIGGPGGAADVLGIPATTLHSKMKKLGLSSRNW
ncbi:MAG TPA: sigma 54-interacting response regulator [Puia sp.]